MVSLDNANPVVFLSTKDRQILPEEEDDDIVDAIDTREVFGRFLPVVFYSTYLYINLTFYST